MFSLAAADRHTSEILSCRCRRRKRLLPLLVLCCSSLLSTDTLQRRLSPHLTSSVKRFGDYTLNMAKPPEPWLDDHTLPRKGPTRLPSQAVLPFVREA
jgi:hypothetical protein